MAAALALLPAAGAGTAAAGTTAAVMTAVSTAATLASMVAAMKQGKAAQNQADYQARIAELNGRREALRVNEQLLETLARNNAAAAAGGLMSAGTVEEAQKENIRKAESELSVIDFNKQSSASAARQSGDNAMASAWGSALNTGVGVLTSAYKKVETVKEVG